MNYWSQQVLNAQKTCYKENTALYVEIKYLEICVILFTF